MTAQSQPFERLTIADGLSQGMIYDIEQTDDGFLWFGTKDGLNRYDGYNFKVFVNDPFQPYSIAGNDIYSLFVDSHGNLWISVLGKGCDVLQKSTGRFLHLSTFPGFQGTPYVNSFEESPDGTIWIGTNGALFSLRWNTDKPNDETSAELTAHSTVSLIQARVEESKNNFGSITAISDTSLLVNIREDGLYDFNPRTGVFIPIGKEDIDRRAAITGSHVAGKVWLASLTAQETVLLPGNGNLIESPELFEEMDVPMVIHSDERGNLFWLAWDDSGCRVYVTPEEEVGTIDDLQEPTLLARLDAQGSSMNLDESGNLWIGTNGYGIRKIKLKPQPFKHYLPGQSVRRVFSTDDLYLRVGISIHTWQLDRKTKSVNQVKNLPTGVFNYLRTQGGGAYVINEFSQHYYLQDYNQSFPAPLPINFPVHEHSPIQSDKTGKIWIGGDNGTLLCFDPSEMTHTILDLSGHLGHLANVHALYFDRYAALWVGTSKGMARVDISTLQFDEQSNQFRDLHPVIYKTNAGDPTTLRYNFVTSFCEDPTHPDKFFWVSTKGGGISLLEKSTGAFRHFTSQNSGLSNDVVYGILPDENGNLWMSTNRGLSRMTCPPAFYANSSAQLTTEGNYNGPVFQNFRESDGLQSDEFNTSAFYRHSDGQLMFGGVNGLTTFFPNHISDRHSDAAVLITNLRINNRDVDHFQKDSPLSRPIHQADKIELRHDQNIVTLDFALLDFVTPEENRFRYKLHGVDPEWVNAGGNHIANYVQLQPGDYTFEVQGNIGYGPWSESAMMQIIILPPWWASWWAYTLYAALVMVITYFIFYFFRKRLVLQHELKLKFEEANRLKELDTFKSQVYTNLTHEFRTPLTVILGMTNQLEHGDWQADVREKEKSKIQSTLKLIENNGKNLLRLINQLLDLSKLESKSFRLQLKQSDIVPFIRYVTESFQSFTNGHNLSLRFHAQLESLTMDFDPEQIKQVVTNLISNAVKFTPSGGDIVVRLSRLEGDMVFEITDTGIGISAADLPYIFDRFYQVDSTATRATQGSGIGLAHTQELVKLMGGKITVDSKQGTGTSIRIALPITTNEQPVTISEEASLQTSADPPVTAPVTDEEYALPNSSLPQLLIIEDNPDVVIYLKSCLDKDYQIMVAYNGRIGIDKALEHIPDFIISDVMMPEKDGYQVCDALKNDERTSHIPIILLTAKVDAVSRLTGLRRGADAYLAKPFQVEELILQIKTLLDNRKRMASWFARTLSPGIELRDAPVTESEDIKIEDAFITKVKNIVAENYTDEDFSLAQLCQVIGMSRTQFFRKMKAVSDTSPADLIRSYRLAKANELLQNSNLTVAEVTYHVGFKDPSYFTKIFQDEFGVLPGSVNK